MPFNVGSLLWTKSQRYCYGEVGTYSFIGELIAKQENAKLGSAAFHKMCLNYIVLII